MSFLLVEEHASSGENLKNRKGATGSAFPVFLRSQDDSYPWNDVAQASLRLGSRKCNADCSRRCVN